MLYQDDVLKANADRDTAQEANNKMEKVIESKLLTLNLEKSCYIVMGEKKARERLMKALKVNPLTLSGSVMKEGTGEKYLGDVMKNNLSESVHETIKRRVAIGNKLVYDIRRVVDDKRSNAINGLVLAFDIFEGAVVPMLLSNAECFEKINSRTLKMLDRLQLRYLRLVLAVGTSCPIVMLLTQTASLLFSNRIWLRKCLFLFHVYSLPVGTLARDTFDIQRRLNIGLYKECEPILREFGLL